MYMIFPSGATTKMKPSRVWGGRNRVRDLRNEARKTEVRHRQYRKVRL